MARVGARAGRRTAVEGGAALLDRLGNRLLDAGATPAGHGSKLAKVLDAAVAAPPDTPEPPADPVHRAVAEQVAELLEWDRAVRADVYDSVHQMRVTTRKIRSLLQASEDAFGLTDDAWVLDELRQLASVLGIARDAEVLAERYQSALDALPAELVRGPVRERLVEGPTAATRPACAGPWPRCARSGISGCSTPWRGWCSRSPGHHPGAEPHRVTIDSAYKRIRKAAKSAEQAVEEHKDEALHRIRKGAKRLRYVAAATGESKVSERAKVIQTLLGDHQDSVVSRAHLSQQAEAAHLAGEDTFTYGLLYQQEEDLADRCRGRSTTPWPRCRRACARPISGAGELACKPDSVPLRRRAAARWRPSIWAHRRRVPRAAYPQARASSPRTPAQPHQVRPLGLASGGFT